MTAKLVKPAHGHGLLQHGSSKGRRARIITREFREIAEAILNDPDVVAALKRRVLLELAGRKRNPLPALAVLGAAAEGQKAKAGSERGAVTFQVAIVQGRGVVERVEPGRELAEKRVDAVEPAQEG